MDKRLEYTAWITDQEFQGTSFNAKPLIETLSAMNKEQASSVDTYEGYSVWHILLHLVYWKHWLTNALGGDAGAFPYAEKDWPDLPEEVSDQAWADLLEYARDIHSRYMTTLDQLPGSKLDTEYEPWKTPYWQLVSWMGTHDAVHAAQIRNMRVPGFEASPFKEK